MTSDAGAVRGHQSERTPHIRGSLPQTQANLSPSPGAFQGPYLGQPTDSSHHLGQKLGLIVPPSPAAPRRGRHGHQDGIFRRFPTESSHPASHGLGQRPPATVLQRVYQGVSGRFQDHGCPGRHQSRGPTPAFQAGFSPGMPRPQGVIATGTAGGGGRTQAHPAWRAEEGVPLLRRDPVSTTQAASGKQEIQELPGKIPVEAGETHGPLASERAARMTSR
jgi:hypothetical protein